MSKRQNQPAGPTQRSRSATQEVKETTESIVIAFILAFVFRAFIVEAFVIPTGSMAATLYGRHGTLICRDCGWENTYGLSGNNARTYRHGPKSRVRCQNCGHLNTNLRVHDGKYSAGGRPIEGPNAEAGDRILVFKWPFDFTTRRLEPHRWDVTVFKNPANGDENFIKRLVGLPNEVLEIIDGDIYTVPVQSLTEDALADLDHYRLLKYKQRTGAPLSADERRTLRRGPTNRTLDELADKLHIQPKSAVARESLWIVVYDHDFPPRLWDPGQPRWLPDPGVSPGWSVEGRRLLFNPSAGRASIRFDTGPNQAGDRVPAYVGPIYDHNAYNLDVRPDDWNPVSDLRVEFLVTPTTNDQGEIEIELVKRGHRFIARIMTDGFVAIDHRPDDQSAPNRIAERVLLEMKPGQPRTVAFQIVDYRVSLEIDGREVLASTPDQFAPDIRDLRTTRPPPAVPPVISARGVPLELRHVRLFRDEYYTAPTIGNGATVPRGVPGWGTSGHPILLRQDDFFMLGDNSPASKDSRLWDDVGPHLAARGPEYQRGTVPRDQLVGKAFFVYWPSAIRPDWLPGRGEHFYERFVPNVGKMRFIR